MMSSIRGKAVVTDASSGIGAVYADRLAKRYDLILVARKRDRLAAVARRIEAKSRRSVETVVADHDGPAGLARIETLLRSDGLPRRAKRFPRACAAVAAMAFLAAQSVLAQAPAQQDHNVFPPWQHGANSDVVDRGVDFTIPQIDDLADFHGDLTDPKLVLYVGGNYFFAMASLVQAFEAAHPEYKGRIYWETIPPGLLVEQLKAGGRITSGNMTWTVKADAYFAGLRTVNALIDQKLLTGPAVPYVTNRLTIMVRQGNPKHIATIADLAQPDLRLAMPNPQFEGVARQTKRSLEKAGGDALTKAVYETKVADGSASLTRIHHRQTPLLLMQGVVDAGVTWQSEAIFQEQIGNPISHVDIPEGQNTTAIYAGAEVAGAEHPQAARAWLEFVRSSEALAIFERYGFKPYDAAKPGAD